MKGEIYMARKKKHRSTTTSKRQIATESRFTKRYLGSRTSSTGKLVTKAIKNDLADAEARKKKATTAEEKRQIMDEIHGLHTRLLQVRYRVATHKVPHPSMKNKPVAQALKKTWGQVNDACQQKYGTSYSGIVKQTWSKYK
jgi:gas vesicle protein